MFQWLLKSDSGRPYDLNISLINLYFSFNIFITDSYIKWSQAPIKCVSRQIQPIAVYTPDAFQNYRKLTISLHLVNPYFYHRIPYRGHLSNQQSVVVSSRRCWLDFLFPLRHRLSTLNLRPFMHYLYATVQLIAPLLDQFSN